MRTPATTSSRMARPLITPVAPSPRTAPTISNASAPTTSTSSGRMSWMDGRSITSSIAFKASEPEERGLGAAGRAKRVVIVVDQRRDRGRGYVEHRLRIDAEQDRQHDERRHDRDLARAEIADRGEGRLLQPPEDDLAVEPERIGGRQDHAESGERHHPVVDLECPEQGEELADEAGGAWQPDIGQQIGRASCRERGG